MSEKNTGTQKCVVFARKKRSHGADALREQELRLLDVAERRGLTVSHVLRDDEMADGIDNRPELRRLVELVSGGECKYVVVEDVSRFARCDIYTMGFVAAVLHEAKATVVLPSRSILCGEASGRDEIVLGMQLGFDEYQAAINRLLRGKARHKRKYFAPPNETDPSN